MTRLMVQGVQFNWNPLNLWYGIGSLESHMYKSVSCYRYAGFYSFVLNVSSMCPKLVAQDGMEMITQRYSPQAKVASRAVSAPRRKSVSKGKSSKRQRMAEPDFMGGESGDDISETHDFTSDMIGKCQACSGVITGAQRVMACSALMCSSKMHSECASDGGFVCHNEDDF